MLTNLFRNLTLAAVTLIAPAASTLQAMQPPPPPHSGADPLSGTLIFDVRNGDQQGKLLLRETDLAFESLTDARHSNRWRYADLRELSKKRRELSVRPFKGSKYSFQFQDNATRDRLYKMISDRILWARQSGSANRN